VPGGAVEASDASLLHGAARELWEETGLVVRGVRRAVPAGPAGGHAVFFTLQGGTRVCRFTFEVDVAAAAAEVRLNPEEHDGFVWASEDECRAGMAGGAALPFATRSRRPSSSRGSG